MKIKRYSSKKEFLKKPLSNYNGMIIICDDSSNLIIVGENDFKELPLSKYNTFISDVIKTNEGLKQAKKSWDDCFVKLQEASEKLNSIREAEERRSKLTDPRVINTIKYKVTRFAIRIKSAAGVQETLDSIDQGVKQMTKFVQNFSDPSNEKIMYDEGEFDIDI